MRKFIFIIILYFLSCFLVGCRTKLDTSSNASRRQTDVIGLELRKLDSLWHSMSERQTLKIEFYRPEMPELSENFSLAIGQGSPLVPGDSATAPCTCMPAAQSHLGGAILPAGGGMGAVKSIEITTESKEEVSAINKTDSTFNNISAAEENRESHVVSEARQDNGTVATVAIVFAVAALIWLAIKTFLKR